VPETELPDGQPGMSVLVGTTRTNRQLPETRVIFSPCLLVLAAGRTPIQRTATERTPIAACSAVGPPPCLALSAALLQHLYCHSRPRCVASN